MQGCKHQHLTSPQQPQSHHDRLTSQSVSQSVSQTNHSIK